MSTARIGAAALAAIVALGIAVGAIAGCGGGDSADAITPTAEAAGITPSPATCERFVGLLVAAQVVEAASADPSDLAADLVSGTNAPSETTMEVQRAALDACPGLADYVGEYASRSTDGVITSMSNHQVWLACRADSRRTSPVCRDVPITEPAQPSAASILESDADADLMASAVRCLTSEGPQGDCPLGWQDALTSGWIGSIDGDGESTPEGLDAGSSASATAPSSISEDDLGGMSSANGGATDCKIPSGGQQPEPIVIQLASGVSCELVKELIIRNGCANDECMKESPWLDACFDRDGRDSRDSIGDPRPECSVETSSGILRCRLEGASRWRPGLDKLTWECTGTDNPRVRIRWWYPDR